MQVTVYQTQLQPVTLIATPGTLRPRAESEQKHGPLRFAGTIDIDEALLPAIIQPGTALNPGNDLVIDDGFGARYVTALLKRSPTRDHRPSVFGAPLRDDKQDA